MSDHIALEDLAGCPQAKKVERAYRALCQSLKEYAEATGRSVCFYVASGSPCVIDHDRGQGAGGTSVTEGGCILIDLRDPHALGASFDGGDW